MEIKNQKSRCIVLFPLPFQGHITPMLHIANVLHSKGFSISIIHTHFNSPDPNRFPHLTFHFIDDGLSNELKHYKTDSLLIIPALNKTCLEPFKDCLSRILRHDRESVACLISDPMWDFTASVADSFNLPRISVRTSAIFSLLAYSCIPLVRDRGYFPLNETKMDDPLPELPPLKVKDLPSESLHDVIETLIEEIKSSKGIVCNSFEELEGSALSKAQQAFPIPIFLIGPLHKFSPGCSSSIWEEDRSSISWLDKQAPKSVIYVSFGSAAAMTVAEFHEIAWGLANSKYPFLWVIRPGSVQGSEVNDQPLPEGYFDVVGERGHIVKWAPQEEVLAHPNIGGFWTHCGWSSTLESICQGVPLICLPFFGDQRINSMNVSENWKIGLKVEKGVTREEIEKVIKKLMVDEEGEEIRNRVEALKKKAKLSVMDGGSSYKSLESLTSYLMSL